MASESTSLQSRAVPLAGLAAEFCTSVATCTEFQPEQFCARILRLLPRIYITISDLKEPLEESGILPEEAEGAIYGQMDEDTYNSARNSMAALFGEYDTFLDTMVEDMQYSDTPIASSISEKLADIYQDMFDMAGTISKAPSELWPEILAALYANFNSYLSDTICAALGAANFIYRRNVLARDED